MFVSGCVPSTMLYLAILILVKEKKTAVENKTKKVKQGEFSPDCSEVELFPLCSH